ncbi:MAG: RDD family protein [Niabella sp.]|nr:MAG: RDD family protein [Niabella sp.]
MSDTFNYKHEEESNLFTNIPVAYGSFLERLAAAIIDGIILYAVGYIVGLVLGDSQTAYTMDESEGFSAGAAIRTSYASATGITSLIINWLYYALMESGPWQATLGKRALGLKVTSSTGNRISFLNATGRYFAKILSAIILLIGYFMMLWDDKKQCLHDKLANTLVVKRK